MEDTKPHVGPLDGKFEYKKNQDGTLDRHKVLCTLCRKEFSFHRSTSSLKYHINAKHTLVGDSASSLANAWPSLLQSTLTERRGFSDFSHLGPRAQTEVLSSGSQNHCNMTESAEAVAADVDSKRSVTLEISNLTNNYCLINPRVHLENGDTYNPPQPTVRPLKTEVCTFTKSSGKATGTVGVLTYDLLERSQSNYIESVAMMFSVPWDYNLYKNWFAVGIYKKGRSCDESLYKEMYYEKNQNENGFVREEATGSGINYVGNYLDIKATMSPLGNSIMKVEVWDKLFTPISQGHY